MKPFERLATAKTPDGSTLELYRHDGSYVIWANGIELMSTRRHRSEDRLAELACVPIRERTKARVLIGGLGLGFTLRAALAELGADAEIVVAELVPEVVEWNANPEFDLSVGALADPRVLIVQDDVTNVLKANAAGFDAIMLDTDNGPDGMLMSENAALYRAKGVKATIAALRPGGRLVYWSVADDPKFAKLLSHNRMEVVRHHVQAHGTSGPYHTLYEASRRVREPIDNA